MSLDVRIGRLRTDRRHELLKDVEGAWRRVRVRVRVHSSRRWKAPGGGEKEREGGGVSWRDAGVYGRCGLHARRDST